MGWFKTLIYSTLVSKDVREAAMLNELERIRKLQESDKRLSKKDQELIRQAYNKGKK